MAPVLIVLSGLPATGKSAVAEAIGRTLELPVFSVDPLEAVLVKGGITRDHGSDKAVYELVFEMAASQLRVGLGAVADAVNGYPPVQERWRRLGREHDVPVVVVETICSDPAVHRDRLETRERRVDGFPYEPAWDDLHTAYAAWYRRFPDPDVVLDAVDDLDANVARALEVISHRGR